MFAVYDWEITPTIGKIVIMMSNHRHQRKDPHVALNRILTIRKSNAQINSNPMSNSLLPMHQKQIREIVWRPRLCQIPTNQLNQENLIMCTGKSTDTELGWECNPQSTIRTLKNSKQISRIVSIDKVFLKNIRRGKERKEREKKKRQTRFFGDCFFF